MRLYRFSLVLAVSTLILIAAGGLVTSHQAGLSVPDWPLSYGQVFPPMVGNVAWEHGHRMIAGTVGILTLLFAIIVQRCEKRKFIKKLVWIAFGAVVLQALLGGLTVIYMLPPAVSVFHACLAQTFFCLIVAIAYFLRGGETVPDAQVIEKPRLRRLIYLTTGFIYLQLILGAIIRHSSFTVIPHIVVAVFVVTHVALVVRRVMMTAPQDNFLSRTAVLLGIFVTIQIFLGIAAFVFTRVLEHGYAPSAGAVYTTAAHQTLGAVILAVSVLMALRVRR